jgi:hypothetical protein
MILRSLTENKNAIRGVMLSPSLGLRINSAKHLFFQRTESRFFGYASE